MAKAPLLPVEDALARILAGVTPTLAESVSLLAGRGRTLAADLASTRDQPPFATSAMDGYAVRAADIAEPGARLALIGASAAGHRFDGEMRTGETVRIFTGAPLPAGADTILIQENAILTPDAAFPPSPSHPGEEKWTPRTIVIPSQSEPLGRFVRPLGLDFKTGDILLRAGVRVGAREIALAAAMNHATLAVRRRPLVAILATGDELVEPGQQPGPDQIIASNHLAVAALCQAAGAETLLLPIAADTFASLESAIAAARNARADILITIGGASVGEHDLVQSALTRAGMTLDFWRIAMRPGKPLMFGALGPMRLIGLPGNPVSSLVCGLIFIRPLIRALLGDPAAADDLTLPAIAGAALPPNDERHDYLRARITGVSNGLPVVMPQPRQDSSMLATLSTAQALLLRAPHAAAAASGAPCRILPLDLIDT